MKVFEWSADMNTGISSIDIHHRRIIEQLNQVIAACVHGGGEDAIRSGIAGMASSLNDHFAEEEALMSSVGYPKLNEHRRLHTAFVARLSDLEDSVRNHDNKATMSSLDLLSDYGRTHILEDDKDFVRFCRDAGHSEILRAA
ncbi:MAG: hemerythrin family protein [Rhodospirillales bacterium]|nr:hemerythrin family protein [Rhodospirillales bacterium]